MNLAQEPWFPFEICDRTFLLVQDYLRDIEYDGLVGLGCDNTKLFKGIHFL